MDKPIELTIDALTYGGRGVGRLDGKAVFVPTVLPGERVLCRILRSKKRYCEAELISVLEPSVERQTPPCRFFPECGGCQWQHIPYAQQLHWKQKIFSEALVRATACDPSVIRPVIGADAEFAYRCRTQVKCRLTRNGFVAGFFRPESHHVVDVDRCLVLDARIAPLLDRFRAGIGGFGQADKLSQVDFCVDSRDRLSMVVHFSGSDVSGLAARMRKIVQAEQGVYLQSGRGARLECLVAGSPQAFYPETDETLSLTFPPGGFIQINLRQNQRMVAEVVGEAIRSGRERVLDLYSGVGNFSLPLARRCTEVLGVEEFVPGVDAATVNARSNAIHNARFVAGRAERVIADLLRSSEHFDTVVLDPPRSGAARVVDSLLAMQPQRIVYVSCDPSTLARDLAALLQGDYRLQSACPIDMFPQTWHIEGIAVLERGVAVR